MFVYIQLGRWHFVGACFSYCQNSGRRTDCRTPTDSLQPCSVLAQPLLVTFSHPGRTVGGSRVCTFRLQSSTLRRWA
eukprot:708284-Prorocentrum_minimum.AAC.1